MIKREIENLIIDTMYIPDEYIASYYTKRIMALINRDYVSKDMEVKVKCPDCDYGKLYDDAGIVGICNRCFKGRLTKTIGDLMGEK